MNNATHNPAPAERRLVRVQAAARYLSVSGKAVRALIATGQLPVIQVGHGANSPFLVDLRDLDHFIECRKGRID